MDGAFFITADAHPHKLIYLNIIMVKLIVQVIYMLSITQQLLYIVQELQHLEILFVVQLDNMG